MQKNEIDTAYMITGLVSNPIITEQNLVDAYQVLLPALSKEDKSIAPEDTAYFETTMYQNAYEQGNAAFMKRAYLRKIVVDHHIGSLRLINKSNIQIESQNYILVYPNPLQENFILRIQILGSPMTKFIITDFAGRTVNSVELNPTNSTIYDCKNLSSGIYFVKLKLQDGSTSQAKFIVQ